VPISIPESLVVALPPILSPSFRTFAELTPRQLAPTVGIAATGFCHLGGILQLFHRQYQQIFSISSRSTNFTAADNRSSQIDSTEFIINISYHLHRQDLHRFIVYIVKNH
jgi:hypothetical protein